MLKISQAEPVNHTVTLRLEGHIVGPWVVELQKSCEEVLAEGRSLRLHLADVEFMDSDAVAFLVRLRSSGIVFIECPLFVLEQLKVEMDSPKNGAGH